MDKRRSGNISAARQSLWLMSVMLLAGILIAAPAALAKKGDHRGDRDDYRRDSDREINFLQRMATQDYVTIRMAQLAQDRATKDRTRRYAADVENRARDRLDKITDRLDHRYGVRFEPRMTDAGRSSLDVLRSVPRDEVDIRFSKMMIDRDQDDIDAARHAIHESNSDDFRDLARNIIRSRRNDVKMFQDFLRDQYQIRYGQQFRDEDDADIRVGPNFRIQFR